MADRRLQGLLPRLIERTRAGEMGWALLPTEGVNAFVHALPEGAGSLVVRRLFSSYQLELRNANGEQLESVGEMVEVPGVATLWHLIDARREQPADAYTALENDLGSRETERAPAQSIPYFWRQKHRMRGSIACFWRQKHRIAPRLAG